MRTRTLLLAGGVLSPALYVASDVIGSIRYDGYSYLHQTISELNAFGAPTRPLTIALGLACYLALVAFGVGVWWTAAAAAPAAMRRLGMAAVRRLRATGVVLFLLGLFSLWAVPFASMSVRGTPQGPLHLVSGAVAIPLILAAMALAGASLGRRFRRFTLASVVVLLAFGVWAGLDGGRIADGLATPWVGVKERVSAYGYQLWLAGLALTLLRGRIGVPAGVGRAPAPGDGGGAFRSGERAWSDRRSTD